MRHEMSPFSTVFPAWLGYCGPGASSGHRRANRFTGHLSVMTMSLISLADPSTGLKTRSVVAVDGNLRPSFSGACLAYFRAGMHHYRKLGMAPWLSSVSGQGNRFTSHTPVYCTPERPRQGVAAINERGRLNMRNTWLGSSGWQCTDKLQRSSRPVCAGVASLVKCGDGEISQASFAWLV